MNRRFFKMCLAIQLGGMVWARAQAPAAPGGVAANAAPEPNAVTAEPEPLAKGVLAEQESLDLDDALKTYQSIIARFEKERVEAGHAVFRLAECYRKLGRNEEAARQYERILREFSDQAGLAKASEDALSAASRSGLSGTVSRLARRQNALTTQKLQLQSEIALAEAQLKKSQERQKLGAEALDSETTDNYKKDLLQLKRQFEQLDQPESTTSAEVSGGYGNFGRGQSKNNYRRSNGISSAAPEALVGSSAPAAGGLPPAYGASSGTDDTPSLGDEYLLGRARSDKAKADFYEANKRLDRLNRLLALVKSSPPTALPESAVRGTRYTNLKADYEKALLDGAEDPSHDKSVSEALKRLQTWIDKIYLPGLEAEINVARDERDLAQSDVRTSTRAGASNKKPAATPTAAPEPATTPPATKR